MNSPFNMPDEYVQGFFKAGQSLLQALAPTPRSPGEIAAPSGAAPLAELQLNYFQQQLALWARMMTGAIPSVLNGVPRCVNAHFSQKARMLGLSPDSCGLPWPASSDSGFQPEMADSVPTGSNSFSWSNARNQS